MLKKILALTLMLSIVFCFAACAKEPEPTEPVETLPQNVFTNQSDDLNYIVMDDQGYLINSSLPDKLRENGFVEGTNDTALSLALGYPKGDAKYLYYQCDDDAANCVYCCVIDNNVTVTISYRVVDPHKLNAPNATYSTANHKTYYANYLSPDKTVDDVLTFMGTPDETEMNDSGFVSKMVWKHKNAEGKVDNKVEIEFVGERVYKITIEKKMPQA